MGHENGDPFECRQLRRQLGPYGIAGLDIERSHGLVEEEHLRRGREGPGEGNALGLASGDFGGPPARKFGDVEPVERLCCDASGLRSRQAPCPRAEGHVLEHGQVREERVVLEHDPDCPITGLNEHRRSVIEHPAIKSDGAGRDRLEPCNGSQQGRLAGAIGPEDRNNLARPQFEPNLEGELPSLNRAGDIEGHGRAARR